MMKPEPFAKTPRSWLRKFADAFRGLAVAVRGQSSFAVHALVSVLVIAAAAWFHVSMAEWCLLALCIAFVWSAELMNTALETIAPAIDTRYNERLRDAIDIASGAVLFAACGSVSVGLMIFVPHVVRLLVP
jgi:diacylglycerol kinase